jgi:hypothetical protein
MAQQKIPVGIGTQILTIDASNFIQGMASSDYAPNGGFGSSSYGINPRITPGLIYSTPNEVDISANVTGNIIASAEDSQATLGYDRLFVDDGAHYYTLSGSTMSLRHSGAKSYLFGTTDMVAFAGNTYVTSGTDMASWNTSSLSLTESWWVTTKSQSALAASNRHPLLVFEQLLWLADGANLWNISSSGTITASAWTLTSGELITALGIEPSTGLMFVAVTTVQNYGDTINAKNFVYIYDGYSAKPRRKVAVDEMVTAFYNIGGTVYIGYGQNLGYWNGNGITFIRKLANVTLSGQDLPYRHHFAHIGNVLLVVDGLYVLAYGEIISGQKVPYYVYKNTTNTNKLQAICGIGNNKLAVAYSSNKLSTVDLSSTAAGIGVFYSSNINFPRPAFIRRVRVFTTGVTTTGGAGVGGIAFVDEKGNTNQPTIKTFIVPAAQSPKYVFDFEYMGLQVQTGQVRLSFEGTWANARIVVYYDFAQ